MVDADDGVALDVVGGVVGGLARRRGGSFARPLGGGGGGGGLRLLREVHQTLRAVVA